LAFCLNPQIGPKNGGMCQIRKSQLFFFSLTKYWGEYWGEYWGYLGNSSNDHFNCHKRRPGTISLGTKTNWFCIFTAPQSLNFLSREREREREREAFELEDLVKPQIAQNCLTNQINIQALTFDLFWTVYAKLSYF
jgi:hypothetical protein